MSSQKLSRSEVMRKVKIQKEIDRLNMLKNTRKVDTADIVYINRMIANLRSMMY